MRTAPTPIADSMVGDTYQFSSTYSLINAQYLACARTSSRVASRTYEPGRAKKKSNLLSGGKASANGRVLGDMEKQIRGKNFAVRDLAPFCLFALIYKRDTGTPRPTRYRLGN